MAGIKFGLTTISVLVFAIYIGNSFHTLYNVFHPKLCDPNVNRKDCVFPQLEPDKNGKWPSLGLRIYISDSPYPSLTKEIFRKDDLEVNEEFEAIVEIKLPAKSRRNGTLWAHAYLLSNDDRFKDLEDAETRISRSTLLTVYQIPEAQAFKLVSDEKETKTPAKKSRRPVSHLRSKLFISIVDQPLILPMKNLPAEIIRHIQMEIREGIHYYAPIFHIDEMSYRIKDLVEIKPNDETVNLTINYRPVSIGKLRLLLTGQASFEQFRQLGFSEKDFDEVKGIFTDTNFYFLMLTVFVSAVHLLLDVLSFKNDISFWRSRDSMVGLSTKTLIWRCISQGIIFLYLREEKTSLLVLLPSGLGVIIECWKLTKALKIQWTLKYGLPWPIIGTSSKAEQRTEELDSEAMRHLAKLMIPLCIVGAIYSLLYVPHKSWYGFIINCLANGVYAFGFLFMLPQLFLNYKLKSVAHLPWRAFMYKAFNTFIDDMFAFIIRMPTAHRIACFRDDIVFLIYLYQRYLYPVDKTRINEYGEAFDQAAATKEEAEIEEKKSANQEPKKDR